MLKSDMTYALGLGFNKMLLIIEIWEFFIHSSYLTKPGTALQLFYNDGTILPSNTSCIILLIKSMVDFPT